MNEQINDNMDIRVTEDLQPTEELLYAAVNFEPERPATYNFASLAMSRQVRRRKLSMWGALASGIACAFVFCAVPKHDSSSIDSTGGSLRNPFTATTLSDVSQSRDLPAEDVSKFQMRQSPARPLQLLSQNRPSRIQPSMVNAPEVSWKTETVHRFESGLMTQMMVSEGKEADGTQIRKSVPVYVPLSGGELARGNTPADSAGGR